jgi:hypothetical protein
VSCPASLQARQFRRIFQVFLKAGEIDPVSGRDILQVKQVHFIGRGVHLPRDEMRIQRNLKAIFGEPGSYLCVIRHHGERPRIRLPFVPAAGAAIERRFVRIVLRGASMRAK